ncbi:DUF4145 domain-containing protein [Proteus mirabilis]|uniref:DUF4145 domain-containing protein n=1 Tax=Proteus TaxID=583 RepID=UPI001A2C9538|nr:MULTISPECIES: DUF4145 domain-containing protein [Proteus]EMA4724024.1 DUF4145 domain-containing protein [Proteus mirabilis]MCD4633283.1 DUF4145 domain-containing protein [Proteus mirabilis]MDC9772463.1 DUF4145 domain-containing protein [Proteus mirabilis]MDF7461937.1 DUF4145 domain-containing protein [Proteus mirabilis]MDL2104391.1 DUF4145 domain-containing protein [Proteus mirabilis]
MGMLSIDTTCPHCLREKAVLIAIYEIRRSEQSPLLDITFKCRSCQKVGLAVVNTFGDPPPLSFSAHAQLNIKIPSDTYAYKIEEIIPKIELHIAPDSTPERAAKFFIESKDDFQRGRYETCTMNCRKVIDIATKYLMGEEVKNSNLNNRINLLFEQGKITEQMNSWAHIVRMDGNGAAHSDEIITEEEAKQILNFTEVFLMYSFTLPAMIEKRRSESKTSK